MTEGLNDSPAFIAALGELVMAAAPAQRQEAFPLRGLEISDAMLAAD